MLGTIKTLKQQSPSDSGNSSGYLYTDNDSNNGCINNNNYDHHYSRSCHNDNYNNSNSNNNTTTTRTTTTTTAIPPSSKIVHSQQPVYQEHLKVVSMTPINQTHMSVTFSGNGTIAVPNTTQTINTSSNGSALISFMTHTIYSGKGDYQNARR
jgi:hypothetical protein